ncbi:hypothetical protein HQN89_28155 [Paenibacillus frigoriresistens]|nr:hypothetical protein [Paenibacillus frigoriresistens]
MNFMLIKTNEQTFISAYFIELTDLLARRVQQIQLGLRVQQGRKVPRGQQEADRGKRADERMYRMKKDAVPNT